MNDILGFLILLIVVLSPLFIVTVYSYTHESSVNEYISPYDTQPTLAGVRASVEPIFLFGEPLWMLFVFGSGIADRILPLKEKKQ
jgi:hypothetical protein